MTMNDPFIQGCSQHHRYKGDKLATYINNLGKMAKVNFPGFGYHLPSFTYRLINPVYQKWWFSMAMFSYQVPPMSESKLKTNFFWGLPNVDQVDSIWEFYRVLPCFIHCDLVSPSNAVEKPAVPKPARTFRTTCVFYADFSPGSVRYTSQTPTISACRTPTIVPGLVFLFFLMNNSPIWMVI